MTAIAALRGRFVERPVAGTLLGAALALLAFAGTLSLLSHGGMFPSRPGAVRPDAAGIALAACSSAPLVLWRRYATAVFATTAGAGVALAALGYPVDLLIGATVALYPLTARRRAPLPRGLVALVLGLFAAYLLALGLAEGAVPTSGLVHTGLAWAAAWFGGERHRLRRQHIEDLRRRAVRAERDSERERLLAVAEERTRIARDLHDSAGHAISVIALRAGSARLRDDPESSRRALEAVESLARRTAGEIDQLVSTLREDHEVEAPAGLESLGTLIDRHAAAGLRVGLVESGEPRPLGAVADQAAYRILQEALTNAARHGTGTARIGLVYGEGAVEFTVANPIDTEGRSRSGGGHGIIGMRERASLVGGSLETDAASGSFEVRTAIPYGGRRE